MSKLLLDHWTRELDRPPQEERGTSTVAEQAMLRSGRDGAMIHVSSNRWLENLLTVGDQPTRERGSLAGHHKRAQPCAEHVLPASLACDQDLLETSLWIRFEGGTKSDIKGPPAVLRLPVLLYVPQAQLAS